MKKLQKMTIHKLLHKHDTSRGLRDTRYIEVNL